ncbi:hypothetical protein ACFPER_09985 [Agromyces aurantiacus]|uniref:DUF4386 family protein n=1 Tax=Agromyces aurantiacus TaxID=165814 RepID=A0ABV9R5Q5_9MICO|nr:hypothetical protein [Agromyces aurantiacus]MBM7503804.1 hypothetical protein [Agromyces aurantiacus]
MSSSPIDAALTAGPAADAVARPARFRGWPLWGALAGVAGFIGTVLTDLRPEGELAAVEQGERYTVTAADMVQLDPTLARYGYVAGVVAIVALLVFQAAWRRHVETAFTRSTAARAVSGGLIATIAGLILGYGWRGGLANYLGPESDSYDPNGRFVYYMLTDFGAYMPWLGVVAAAGGLAWMAFVERNVSRVLGAVSALAAVLTLGAVIVSGVPGLPGGTMPLWLAIAGVWLAVGRSRITRSPLA